MSKLHQQKLRQQQSLPLEAKIQMTKKRIKEWCEHWDGDVYVSFSGGKDSTVLLDIIDSIDDTIPAVFSDTGLEYPEIRQFVKSYGDRVTWVKPARTFRDVLQNEGYPVVSKRVAESIRRLRMPQGEHNAKTRKLILEGINSKGEESKGFKLAEKWKPLIDAPFKISEKCCDEFKKKPLDKWRKENGNPKGMTGMMAAEGGTRARVYHQCNNYDNKRPVSNPLFFWTESDVWEYINTRNIKICEIYYDRTIGGIPVEGEKRTGCMFCTFGAHMEQGQNRFQKMKITHPKQWDYCINKLGMGKVLKACGVDYEPTPDQCTKDLFGGDDE